MGEQQGTLERNDLFQNLKPCCVRISQLAIRESEAPNAARELQDLTSQAFNIISHAVRQHASALDEKLAEYVFFPLYHIFRAVNRYPARVMENCVKCLQLLIQYGWESRMSSKLVQQLFSLLIFITNGVAAPQSGGGDMSEELQLEAFRTLSTLLTIAGQSANAISGLTEQHAMPALGHGITIMLDSCVEGVNPHIQEEALGGIQAMYATLRDQATLANFLPGTVSSMTRLLSLPKRHKASVLAKALETVQTVVVKVLGDMRVRSILQHADHEEQETQQFRKDEVLTLAWLRATAAQINLALSTMMKLRVHDSQKVRGALERLCISLLDECHGSLSNCSTILVESAIILDQSESSTTPSTATQTNFLHLANIYPELGDIAKTAVYGWLSSLPRIMQCGDEEAKTTAIHNVSGGIDMLQGLAVESSMLEDVLGNSLKDSIISLMHASKQTQSTSYLQLLDESRNNQDPLVPRGFKPVFIGSESQKMLRHEIASFIACIGSSSLYSTVASSMMDHIRESESADQIAAFWLCLEFVKVFDKVSTDTDSYLDLSALSAPPDNLESIFEGLFAFSVQVLESHADSDPADWRLEAIALEVASYCAEKQGPSFRPYLMDVLFPVATFLGSENQFLQQHAIIALNNVARSCEYTSVSELIISNVDYMVNSVSLRLNSLDVSPASVQVLKMMIRLSGPQLIPYLNDVIDSIFAALENYHGYTLLSEDFFCVLKEIVDQAIGIDQRLLIDRERNVHNYEKRAQPVKGLDDFLEELDRRERRRLREEEEEKTFEQVRGHPKEPWTSGLSGEDDGEDGTPPPPEPEKSPNSPTYQLLLRISSLTQHYLTCPTPRLRRSLLELLNTASSVLSGDEDCYLPFVNDIWPVVVDRLRDPEPFVSIEACHTLSSLCEAAGDFLSTRFKTEWGDWLREWCRKVRQKERGVRNPKSHVGKSSRQGHTGSIMIPIRTGSGLEMEGVGIQARTSPEGGLGQYASPVKMWDAVVKLLTAIVRYVSVEDGMFDEIVGLLVDVLETDDELREALEAINADTVWLARYEMGRVEHLPTPAMEGVRFVDM